MKAYCEDCDKMTPAKIDKMKPDTKQETVWGDITCLLCGLVLLTIELEGPTGAYQFKLISDEDNGRKG